MADSSEVAPREHQGTNLPDSIDEKLDNITKLENHQGYRRWETQVRISLGVFDFDGVLNADLSRPSPNDPKHKIWRQTSKKATGWLLK